MKLLVGLIVYKAFSHWVIHPQTLLNCNGLLLSKTIIVTYSLYLRHYSLPVQII